MKYKNVPRNSAMRTCEVLLDIWRENVLKSKNNVLYIYSRLGSNEVDFLQLRWHCSIKFISIQLFFLTVDKQQGQSQIPPDSDMKSTLESFPQHITRLQKDGKPGHQSHFCKLPLHNAEEQSSHYLANKHWGFLLQTQYFFELSDTGLNFHTCWQAKEATNMVNNNNQDTYSIYFRTSKKKIKINLTFKRKKA